MNPSHMYSMWPNGQRNINSPSPFQSAAAANYSNPTNRLQALMNATAPANNPYNQMVASYAPASYDRPNSVSLSRNPAMDYASMQKIPSQFSAGSFYNTSAAAHNPYDIYRQNCAVSAANFSDLNRSNGALMGKDPLSAHSASAYSNLFSQGFPSAGNEPLLTGLTARDYSSPIMAISHDVVNSVFESSLISHGQQQHQQQQQHLQQTHAQQAVPQHAQQASAVAQQQQQSRSTAAAHLELQQTQQPSPISQTAASVPQQPPTNVRRNSQGASSNQIEKSRHTSDPYSCQQSKVPQAQQSQVPKQQQAPPQNPQAQQQQPQQQAMQNPPSVPSHAPGSVDALAQSPRQPHSIASYHSPAEHTPQTPKTPRVLTFSDELRHLASVIEKCGSPSSAPDFTSRTLDIISVIDKLGKYTGILKTNSETQTSSSSEDELFIVDSEVKEFCRTVPRELVIRASKAPQGGIRLGVWGREEIPSASEFGPFKGRLCQSGTIVPDTADDHWLVRSLRSSNTYYFLPDRSNPPPRWMMFINSGYSEQGIEPNCFLLCQSDNEYIIRVMCSIQPENEVLICVNEDLLPSHLIVSPLIDAPKEKTTNISPGASAKRPLPPLAVQEHSAESDVENNGNMSDQIAETDSEQLPTPVKVKSKSKKKKKGGKKMQGQSSPAAAKEVIKTIYFEDIPFYITHYACRDCKKYFLECSAYETHRKSYHEDNLPWRCKLCDAIGYKELGKLKSHYKKEHDKEDKIQYFDKCRNEAIELGYQVDFEQDLSLFVEYELFSGSRKLKSKRKLTEKVVVEEEPKEEADLQEESGPEKKRARYESDGEEQPKAPLDNEVNQEGDEADVLADEDLENEDEDELAEEKPKHSGSKKSSSSKRDKGGSKSKKRKGGKKSSSSGKRSGTTNNEASSGSKKAHRQSVIEISVEDDDGEQIKMKFDADEDDYMNDEELMTNLQLNTAVESDAEYGSPALSSASKKKKKKSVKAKKGKKKSGVSPVSIPDPAPPPTPPPESPPPVQATRSSKSGKGKQKKEAPVSPAASKSPKGTGDRGSKSKAASSKSAKGRGRSKTPPVITEDDDNNEDVDEKVIADILAAENKKHPAAFKERDRNAESSVVEDIKVTASEDADIKDAGKMSPDIKRKPEKKFECYLCLDKFIMVAKFERHMMEVHKIEKPWKCEHCEMSFKRYFLMSQHVKIRHANDQEEEEDEGQVSSQSDRLSENDVSGLDQSENESEDQPLANNLVNKPLAHYNPLDHLRQKHSSTFLPAPAVVSKMSSNVPNSAGVVKPEIENPEYSNRKTESESDNFNCRNDKAQVALSNVNQPRDAMELNPSLNRRDSLEIEAESENAETSLALESISALSSEQVVLQGESDFSVKSSSSCKKLKNHSDQPSDASDCGGKEKRRKVKTARTFVCEHCDPQVEFNQAAKYSRHLAEMHDIKKAFKCELCLRSFASQQAVDNHQKRCGTALDSSSGGTAAALRCDKCNIEIKSMKQYTLHMSGDHSASVPYLCQLCKYQFPRASVLSEHLRSVHSVVVKESQLTPLVCSPKRNYDSDKETPPQAHDFSTLQSRLFDAEDNSAVLKTEQAATTPSKVCDTKMSSLSETWTETSTTAVTKNTSSSERPSLDVTQTSEDNNTAYPNTNYSKLSAVTSSLASNGIIASSSDTPPGPLEKKPKQIQCQICWKWMDKNYFQDHMNLHNGNKPYECEICKQRFAQRAGLAYHKRNHHPTLASTSTNAPNTTSAVQTPTSVNTSVLLIPTTTVHSSESASKIAIAPVSSSSQSYPLVEINGPSVKPNVSTANAQIQPKPIAPSTSSCALPIKAVELILQQNRTILPASAKPSATGSVPSSKSNQPAIIIPANSAGKTTFQLAPTSADGKQAGKNFILTPVTGAVPSAVSSVAVGHDGSSAKATKSTAAKKSTKSSSTGKKTAVKKANNSVVANVESASSTESKHLTDFSNSADSTIDYSVISADPPKASVTAQVATESKSLADNDAPVDSSRQPPSLSDENQIPTSDLTSSAVAWTT